MLKSLLEKQKRSFGTSRGPSTTTNDTIQLPSGWVKRVSKRGNVFYYNNTLHFTQPHFPTDEDINDPNGAKERSLGFWKKQKDKDIPQQKDPHPASPSQPGDQSASTNSAQSEASELLNLASSKNHVAPPQETQGISRSKDTGPETPKECLLTSKERISETPQSEEANSEETHGSNSTKPITETKEIETPQSKEANSEETRHIAQTTNETHSPSKSMAAPPNETKDASTSPVGCNPITTINAWETLPDGTLKGELADGTSFVTRVLLTIPKSNEMITTEGGSTFQLLEHKSVAKKRKRASKRKVGDFAKSVRQMKDAPTRLQAGSFAVKAHLYQKMSRYETPEQNQHNPTSNTYVLNRDEIVPKPNNELGLNSHRKAQWTILCPEGMDEKEVIQDLQELAKELTSKKRKASNSDPHITQDPRVYLDRLYGEDAGLKLIAKVKERDLQEVKEKGGNVNLVKQRGKHKHANNNDEEDMDP
jgi:hypothetical protein